MSLVAAILGRPEFQTAPPVLVDIGASGGIHRDWAALAPYSVCVAFDPDAREMGGAEQAASGYRKLVVVRALVHDREVERAEFHLTRSPYCSSLLRPRPDALADWAFDGLFEVTGTATVPAVTLPRVLAEHGLERVDWFKTDSQGMDLRLFRSLGEERLRRVIAAQFEPGILEAYQGEDHLSDLLAFMRERGFWLSDLELQGSQRIGRRGRAEMPAGFEARARRYLRTSPGWGEATYLSALAGNHDARDLMLGWVIATLRRQHGFALELALRGRDAGSDAPFDAMRRSSVAAMRRRARVAPALAALRRAHAWAARLLGGTAAD